MENKTDNKYSGRIGRRAIFAFAIQGLGVFALANRAKYLQVVQGEKFTTIAENNRITTRLVPAPRGEIFDNRGKPIAANQPDFKVYYDKIDGADHDAIIVKISKLINLPADQQENLKKKIKNHTNQDRLALLDHMRYKDFALVTENLPALPGCQTSMALSRLYPFTKLFAHSVGYVGRVSSYNLENMKNPHPIYKLDGAKIGKSGAELLLEPELRGKEERRVLERKPDGQIVRLLDKTTADAGTNFQLTLDAEFQNYALKRMENDSAAAVIIDVETGDIKLMASSPSFDPNPFVTGISQTEYDALQNNERHPLLNKPVSGQYPPGSTFKMVTALAGLEAGKINANTAVTCKGKIKRGRDFYCHGVHGYVNLKNSFKKSCDIFYYINAEKTGIEAIVAMAKRLGLGQKYDIPLNYQREGLLGDVEWKKQNRNEEWYVGDTMIAGIGQGYIEATPLQLAIMTARIASGKAVVPRLAYEANVPREAPQFESLGISEESLRLVRNGMWAVANESGGTALRSRIEGSKKWAGKTGTSQVVAITKRQRETGSFRGKNIPWEFRDHALFVAFAPYDKPKYAISVVVEHGGGGSTAAAPIARDLMLYALNDGPPPLSDYPASARGQARDFIASVPNISEMMYDSPGNPTAPASGTSSSSDTEDV